MFNQVYYNELEMKEFSSKDVLEDYKLEMKKFLSGYDLEDFKPSGLNKKRLQTLQHYFDQLLKAYNELDSQAAHKSWVNNHDQFVTFKVTPGINMQVDTCSFEPIKEFRSEALHEERPDLNREEKINSEILWAKELLTQCTQDPNLQPVDPLYKRRNHQRAALKKYIEFLQRWPELDESLIDENSVSESKPPRASEADKEKPKKLDVCSIAMIHIFQDKEPIIFTSEAQTVLAEFTEFANNSEPNQRSLLDHYQRLKKKGFKPILSVDEPTYKNSLGWHRRWIKEAIAYLEFIEDDQALEKAHQAYDNTL